MKIYGKYFVFMLSHHVIRDFVGWLLPLLRQQWVGDDPGDLGADKHVREEVHPLLALGRGPEVCQIGDFPAQPGTGLKSK